MLWLPRGANDSITESERKADADTATLAQGTTGCVVISNTNENAVPFNLQLQGAEGIDKCMVISEGKVWCECELPKELPGFSVLCVYYK